MVNHLADFFNKEPEKVITWNDSHSDAQGWLVINSLYNRAAGGGTRMRSDCVESEILQLAKTMEIKFTVSGPSIGGAKSGIRYDFKDDQDKMDVLSRWFAFIKTELKSCYGTGGDQNVDIQKHVIPILRSLGILHPQEGIANGLYPYMSEEEKKKVFKNLNDGVVLKLKKDSFLSSIDFRVSDVATGFGVTAAIEKFYKKTNGIFSGKKVIVEGFGNVGAGTVYYAVKSGAKIVGIIDKDWHIFDNEGIDANELLKLRKNGLLTREHPDVVKYSSQIEVYPNADIFIPAATSHTIDRRKLKMLKASGVKLIALGANNAFIDSETEEDADQNFSVIADFIANAGMARYFSYLMNRDSVVNENAIMEDIRLCMNTAMDRVLSKTNSEYHLNQVAYDIALDDITNRI